MDSRLVHRPVPAGWDRPGGRGRGQGQGEVHLPLIQQLPVLLQLFLHKPGEVQLFLPRPGPRFHPGDGEDLPHQGLHPGRDLKGAGQIPVPVPIDAHLVQHPVSCPFRMVTGVFSSWEAAAKKALPLPSSSRSRSISPSRASLAALRSVRAAERRWDIRSRLRPRAPISSRRVSPQIQPKSSSAIFPAMPLRRTMGRVI